MPIKLEGTKVLVSGAGGFIGSHLCEALLAGGAEVTAMIRYTSRSGIGDLELIPENLKSRLKILAGNIEDAHFVQSAVAGHDTVFHLAALIAIPYSYIAPLSYVRTNVEGTLNIFEAAKRLGVRRVVHTSTSEVYGTAKYVPIDEEHPLQGQSPYSASKIAADKVAESYNLSFDLPVVTIRPFNTYGPRQSARAIIPSIIAQALSNSVVRIGSLSPVRDLTYVTDTVQGFIKASTTDGIEGETINLGTGSAISIGELANRIFELLGIPASLRVDESRFRPEKSEVLRLLSENAKAKRLLQWTPQYGLDEGLEQTITFIRANPGRFDPSKFVV